MIIVKLNQEINNLKPTYFLLFLAGLEDFAGIVPLGIQTPQFLHIKACIINKIAAITIIHMFSPVTPSKNANTNITIPIIVVHHLQL